MTLRQKTLLAAALGLLGAIIVLYGLSKIYLTRNYVALENALVETNIERLTLAVADKVEDLSTAVGDWSVWDDAYSYVLHPDRGFVQRNLGSATYSELGLNVIIFINSEGEVVYEQGFDLQRGNFIRLPKELVQRLSMVRDLGHGFPSGHGLIKGLIYLKEGPMIIASRPIVPSSGQGKPVGALIMGRYVDEELTKSLSSLTRLSIGMRFVDALDLPRDFSMARDALLRSESNFIQPISAKKVAGYVLIRDIYNLPAMIARVDMPRNIIRQGQRTIDLYMLWFGVLALALTAGVIYLIERLVLNRLMLLSRGVESIGVRGDAAGRVHVVGNDELSRLAKTINDSLEALEKSQMERHLNEEKLRTILDNTPNPVLVMDDIGNFIEANDAAYKFLEVPTSALNNLNYWQVFNIPSGTDEHKPLINEFSLQPESYERSYSTANGSKTLLLNIVPFKTPNEERYYAIGQDISERKRVEERLTYANTHDSLTGLHNRVYFEEALQSKAKIESSVAVMVLDINGLKLVNDGFGMEEGDRLLLHTAQLIEEAIDNPGAVVSRIGGDEFAIVIPYCTQEGLEQIESKIQAKVEQFNTENNLIPLSLAVGSVVWDLSQNTSEGALKAADDAMQREKLHQAQSTRSTVVKTLMKALEARDFITEGHADRLQDIVAAIATEIGLPHARVADLRLFGQFHDIGKVGIPDRILLKNGSLTAEEKTEMQRHSEIGYRIAQASPDLVPIADWILKHHEWWSGQGYPLGLKGDEIPLECRILAIADAYDAMTSDRPYRRAMTHEKAADELKRWAGVQFDPDLVRRFLEIKRKNEPTAV